MMLRRPPPLPTPIPGGLPGLPHEAPEERGGPLGILVFFILVFIKGN